MADKRWFGTVIVSAWVAGAAIPAWSASSVGDDGVVPSPLLSIDRNRQTVIDRIVSEWGSPLEQSSAGITSAQLRTMLEGLRADHLLAASLVGSLTGLRDVLGTSLATDRPAMPTRVPAKTLGDPADDLVYTPVPPCRLFDTRISQGGLGTPTLNVRRTYGAITPVAGQGGPGGCAAAQGTAVALIQVGTLTPSGSGILQGGPQGAASFPNALILYQSGDQYSTAVAMPLNANGQFDLVEQFASADLYGDLLGYFKPPSGLIVTATDLADSAVTTPKLASGAVTAAKLANGAVTFPAIASNGCTTNQIMKYSGSAWVCAADSTPQALATTVVTQTFLPTNGVCTSVANFPFTPPASGKVKVTADIWMGATHFFNTQDHAILAIATSPTDCTGDGNFTFSVYDIPAQLPNAFYQGMVPVHRIFPVTGGTAYTFYLNGSTSGSPMQQRFANMILEFFPN